MEKLSFTVLSLNLWRIMAIIVIVGDYAGTPRERNEMC